MNSANFPDDQSLNSSSPQRLIRFILGFLFVLAFFLVEIGISEIVLVNDAQCREAARSGKLVLDPYDACLPEVLYHFFNVLSRGPFAIIAAGVEATFAWFVTGTFYGLIGGILAQFTPRFALGVWFGVHLGSLILMTAIAFISNYIV